MPVLLTTKKIIKEWTDYNNHMNLSYYILVFDMGAEVILSKFKMGEHSAKTTKKSTMVVETHTTYNQEVKEGDYLLLTGDPAIIGVACSIVSDITNGKYQLLKWDKQERKYYSININLHEKGAIDE